MIIKDNEQTRIVKEVLDKARDHCNKEGLKLYVFLSKAIDDELERIKADEYKL